MGLFLNNTQVLQKYCGVQRGKYFVDKSKILEDLFEVMGTELKYLCITRPRRFGKTIMANMIASFFIKGTDSKKIFDSLWISNAKKYTMYLNQYDVIYIDFSCVPDDCRDYASYIARIRNGLKKDLLEQYAKLQLEESSSVADLLSEINQKENGKRFIFVIDEWDAVFHMSFITEMERQEYLLFLKNLLKDKAYVELAYMTGILPIAKYSDGSELNMFTEFQMTVMEAYSEYFGFTDKEVDQLYKQFLHNHKEPKVSREDLREWYDGYYSALGTRIYNPKSIVNSLHFNQIANYWTGSGVYDSVFYYVKNNVHDLQDDLALMIAGEKIPAHIQEYAAVSRNMNTKDEIYSAMVVYGLLTYKDGEVMIPNREIADSFAYMIKKEESLGYIHHLAQISDKMLQATLQGDTEIMEHILEYAHNTETPILSYNHESELSAVVNLVYLQARDKYRIEREDRAGKGYVDFIFYPEKTDADCIILELKVDDSPENAIAQIKEKEYIKRFQGKLGKKRRYTGRALAVGISYEKKDKKHSCKVEVLE